MIAAAPAGEMQRKLVRARDEHLSQVVALVDAMPVRGAADKLIEPLRPRLAALSLARPITLSRLLFRPLDPVILPAAQWQPGMPAVPRVALGPIGGLALQGLAAASLPAARLIAGRTWADEDAVGQAGALLWPAAAASVERLACPPGWLGLTGLPDDCFEGLRGNIAAVLRQGVQIGQCARLPDGPELRTALRGVLTQAALGWSGAQGIVLATLLGNPRLAGAALAAAGKLSTAAVEAATQHALDRADRMLAAVLPGLGLAGAATQAVLLGTLLEGMEQPGARPTLRGRVQRVRQSADAACQERLHKAVASDFLPRVTAAGTGVTDAEVTALEGVARGLRRLANAGRRFGAGATYDRLLDDTVAGMLRAPTPGLRPMDRLRLAELLLGSAAALHLHATGILNA